MYFTRSEAIKSKKTRPSRKLSAPAMLRTEIKDAGKELVAMPLEPPLEEKSCDSSEASEFEVIPDDITQSLSCEAQQRETSFTGKIFGEGL